MFGLIFENPLYATVLKGALKTLSMVALATFDWKLSIITKSLEEYIKDKEEEWDKEQEKRKKEKEQLGLY